MAKLINPADYIGNKYGRLTVLEIINKNYKGANRNFLKAICECGNIIEILPAQVRHGHTKSCGCIFKEMIINRNKTHGLATHTLHSIWSTMKGRCYGEYSIGYKHYGGRGITVCDEWKNDFMAFYNWCMANGWEKGLHIDRRENNGNYTPDNCRIVTQKVNNNNKRNNVSVTIGDKTKNMSQWHKEDGISIYTLRKIKRRVI